MTDRAALTIPPRAQAYQGRPAGLVTRMVAGAVDCLVAVAIIALVYGGIAGLIFLAHPSSFHWPTWLSWSLPVFGLAVVVPYLTLSWCTTGRTYGDSLLGLRVVNFRGERMRIGGAALRAVVCTVFPIGILWVAISPANRSVADVILRSSVVYAWAPRPVDLANN